MEEATNNPNFSESRATHVTLAEPVSIQNNYDIVTITGMETEYYNAALKGNIDLFRGKSDQIESILTPNKNTILHIHFTNYTDRVSQTFVEEVLGMCPALFLKTNVKDETILHIAARHGHHEIVMKLIDTTEVLSKCTNEVGAKKRLIRAVNDKKNTALHEAARYGHTKIVDLLIKEEPEHSYFGANVDGETPLYIAVERQQWNVVNTMLDNGTLPQYDGPNGRTALHAAVLHGDRETVSKLLTRKSSAAKQADENGWVPLHLAALCDSLEVIELLVSIDRSTAYMRDKKGRTALHLAALNGSLFAMEKIIECCPDCCELVDEKGSNALHCAMMGKSYGYFDVKKNLQDAPLISNMCNEKDDDGNTPLHLLARHAPERHPHFYNTLLEPQFPRVDTMACNNFGQTVLDIATADMPETISHEKPIIWKLKKIGARHGERDMQFKHLGERKQEKRDDDSAVDEKDYFTGVATTISVVAILIATVTFTAGFTLPGGLVQEGEHQGSPILKYNAAFIAFVLTDSLSFVLSTSAVLALFFSTVLRKAEILYKSLLRKCIYLTIWAMGFMVIAFGMGIYAVLGVSKGLGLVILLIVWLFFFVSLGFVCRIFVSSVYPVLVLGGNEGGKKTRREN